MVTSKPPREPGLGEQRFRARHVEPEWTRIVGAQNPVGHERLMDDARAAQNAAGDAVVIDEVFERLDHARPAQDFVALVQRQIGLHRLKRAVEHDRRIVRERFDLVLVEIARIVGIAAHQQQALRRGLGDVEDDDLAVLGRARHGVEHVALVRAPIRGGTDPSPR